MPSKQVELTTKTEYRTVRCDGMAGMPLDLPLDEMEKHRQSLEADGRGTYRLQKRTVTESPWVDIDDGGSDD